MVLLIVNIQFPSTSEIQTELYFHGYVITAQQCVRTPLNPIFIEKYMLKATNLAFKIDAMSDIVVMSGLATWAAPIF